MVSCPERTGTKKVHKKHQQPTTRKDTLLRVNRYSQSSLQDNIPYTNQSSK